MLRLTYLPSSLCILNWAFQIISSSSKKTKSNVRWQMNKAFNSYNWRHSQKVSPPNSSPLCPPVPENIRLLKKVIYIECFGYDYLSPWWSVKIQLRGHFTVQVQKSNCLDLNPGSSTY